MTLILKLDPDMVELFLHTENEVLSYSGWKVIAWTDKQSDKPKWNYYLPLYAYGKKDILAVYLEMLH